MEMKMARVRKKPALDKANVRDAIAKIGDRIMNDTDGLGTGDEVHGVGQSIKVLDVLIDIGDEIESKRRARQRRDEIPPEWRTRVEQRVAAEIEEWKKENHPQE